MNANRRSTHLNGFRRGLLLFGMVFFVALVPSLIGRPVSGLSVNTGRSQTFASAVRPKIHPANATPLQAGGAFELKQSVIAGGGGTSTNGTMRLEGTVGQAVVGTSAGGSFAVNSGFWQGGQQPSAGILIDGSIRYYSTAVPPINPPPPGTPQPPTITCLDSSFDAAKPVPGATVAVISGSPAGTSTASDAAGMYSVSGLGAGPYVLQPGKSSPPAPPPPPPGISSLDATRIQNFLVGIQNLNECQRLAGDTTNNNTLSTLDATRIQQYLTSITNTGITGTWKFVPSSRNYLSLTVDLHNENYNAVLVGDVNGNLTPSFSTGITLAPPSSPQALQTVQSPTAATVPIFFPNRFVTPGQLSAIVPINVTNLPANNSPDNLQAYDLVINFNPAVLRPNPSTGVGANSIVGTLSNTAGASVITNLPGGPGTGVMSISGSLPNSTTNTMTESGVLLNLVFDVIGAAGTMSTMNITFASLEGNGSITPVPASGTVTVGPTAIAFQESKVSSYENGSLIEWRTGFEADNLGFNIYREEGGNRIRVNKEVIAGSSLMVGSATNLQAGQSYGWWDNSAGNHRSQYWIEGIDLNGQRTMYGPFAPRHIGGKPARESRAELLSQMGSNASAPRQTPLVYQSERSNSTQARFSTMGAAREPSGLPALKLTIREEGWYRVTRQELAAAGFDSGNPRNLQLYQNGIEQSIRVVGELDGRVDSIEFFATGQDKPTTDERVYWLVSGDAAGRRIGVVKTEPKSGGARSFPFTIERRDRSVYFAGLRNGDADNFFGQVITSRPVDQILSVRHIDSMSTDQAELEIALQGVTELASGHSVRVLLNGSPVGRIMFGGQTHKTQKFAIGRELLKEGDNVVTLATETAEFDVCLVDYIRVTYPHTYTSEQDSLRMSMAAGSQTIEGFSDASVRVFDITDPGSPVQLEGNVALQGGSYVVSIETSGQGTRTLFAFTDGRIKTPASISLNEPSNWRNKKNRADLVIITRKEFFTAIEPLKALRESQGLRVEIVDIVDIFDEFSDGERSPQAVKDFLATATTTWKRKPSFVLFAGHASLDPRNYLGFGDSDLVPTRLLDTGMMETASDDWFVDFNDDGLPELAVGRLPFRTKNEAVTMVTKILAYERSRPATEVLLVSDVNDGFDFEAANGRVRETLPIGLKINRIDRGRVDAATAKSTLISSLNRGQKIVNYMGHGSVNQWKGDLLTNDDARALTNADHLSVFVMMTCLNGYFQDVGLDSLAESLLKAEHGGAVAVWASSGMTGASEQATVNQRLYLSLFEPGLPKNQPITLGEAMMRAKAATVDPDVRRTWVLLGDPTMRLK